MKLRFLFMGFICLFIMVSPNSSLAKTEFKIAMIIGSEGETLYHQQAIQEINTLLENRVDVEYKWVTVGPDWGGVQKLKLLK